MKKILISLLILTSCSTKYKVISKEECRCILKYNYEIINKQDTIIMQSNKLYYIGDKCKVKWKR